MTAETIVAEMPRHTPTVLPTESVEGGGRAHPHDPLLPYGVETADHVWLHSCCWEAWHANRRAKAAAVLLLTLRAG
jgi:hypothetical protein